MRIVDIHTLPARTELHEQLVEAWARLDGDRGTRVDPVDPGSPLGLGFDASLDDAELREHARVIRDRLAAELEGAGEVRFQLADGSSATAGGSPNLVR